LKRSGFPNR